MSKHSVMRKRRVPQPYYETVIFDLDGTLVDSKIGVVNAMRYSLEQLQLDMPESVDLDTTIGPPLRHTFFNTFGVDEARLDESVNLHRAYYGDRGVFEAEPYPGVFNLMRDLHLIGVKVCVATSKYSGMAKKMLDHFAFSQWILYMAASDGTELHSSKAAMLKKVLAATYSSPKSSIMIGDTHFDIQGAIENNMPSIGVLYGYGSKKSMEEAGATYFAADVEELRNLLIY